MINHFLFSVVPIFKMAAIMEIPIIGDYYNSGTIINIGAMDASLLLELVTQRIRYCYIQTASLLKSNSSIMKEQQKYVRYVQYLCVACVMSDYYTFF